MVPATLPLPLDQQQIHQNKDFPTLCVNQHIVAVFPASTTAPVRSRLLNPNLTSLLNRP